MRHLFIKHYKPLHRAKSAHEFVLYLSETEYSRLRNIQRIEGIDSRQDAIRYCINEVSTALKREERLDY